MPTVLRIGPYRLFFYSGDGGEPPHVHVERDDNTAKVWHDPVRLSSSAGFKAQELRDIVAIVVTHRATILETWNDNFGT